MLKQIVLVALLATVIVAYGTEDNDGRGGRHNQVGADGHGQRGFGGDRIHSQVGQEGHGQRGFSSDINDGRRGHSQVGVEGHGQRRFSSDNGQGGGIHNLGADGHGQSGFGSHGARQLGADGHGQHNDHSDCNHQDLDGYKKHGY